MQERTEEEALDRRVVLTLGGREFALRTLPWEQSDEWLGLVDAEVSGTDLSAGDEPPDLRVFLTTSSDAALRLVAAYDTEDVLGGEDGIRAIASKREVRTALEVLVAAEDPFGEDAVRSVVAAFGEPSRQMWRAIALVVNETGFLRALWTAGRLGKGSATPTSDATGPASNSSSAGPTRTTTTRRKRKAA